MTRIGIQDETSLNLRRMLVDLWVSYTLLIVGADLCQWFSMFGNHTWKLLEM